MGCWLHPYDEKLNTDYTWPPCYVTMYKDVTSTEVTFLMVGLALLPSSDDWLILY
jgi:hypothetical protein